MTVRLVVVDDQPDFLAFARARLERHAGVRVIAEAREPGDLWAAVALGLPDAILLDVWLGVHSGLEVCLRLREGFPGLKVLMMSSDEDGCSQALALAHGAVGFLPKKLFETHRVLDRLGFGICAEGTG